MLAARRLVHVINLQRMGFVSAFDIQQRYERFHLEELMGRQSSKGYNVILLVEHNPVYTVGLRDTHYTTKQEEELRELGADFQRTTRGGLITFHGPGQLVAYPIINLKHFGMGIRDYVCALEKTMIKTCDSFKLAATTTKDTGVWIEDRKIGAIGIHGSRFITTHGISLNCNTDLSWFKHIVPCGIEGKGVTSLSEELNKEITLQDTVPFFLEAFQEKFDCTIADSFLQQEDFTMLPTKDNLERIESEVLSSRGGSDSEHLSTKV